MCNSEYYYDDPSDEDEVVLTVNNIDASRKFAGDPFDIVAEIEEASGRPLAMSFVSSFNIITAVEEELQCSLTLH